ncbi:uncharacterized protein LOC119689302 [Teleopsis dalmanni]|uniref:uncharacterized protein LOC119689302 n=1 Tax=Teleopsis dalmanni TaxID=139649 RepID=UPI0018CF263A|nr:uncharacterized protein LOC119689302 [Teleopsis dalmanni]
MENEEIDQAIQQQKEIEAAIELLKQRYKNPVILVDNLINKLLSLRVIRNENAQDLKTLIGASREVLYGIHGETRKLYQHSRGASTQIPKSNSLYEFIESRVRGLEAARDTNRENKNNFRPTAVNTKTHVTTVHTLCLVCNSNYQLIRCSKFLNMKVPERREKIMSSKLCFNCLQSGHFSKLCLNKRSCTICDTKHHHLLHEQVKGKPTFTNNINKQRMPILKNTTETEVAASYNIQKEKTVLLATAMVIKRTKKQLNPIRALLDQGSQSCIITEQLARSIRAPLTNYQTHVKGINGQITSVIAKCSLEIQSIHDKYKKFTPEKWSHIDGLQLADPWYAEPKEIQLLIGSDVLPEVFKEGLIKGNSDEYLKRFWELEEIPNADLRTVEERRCERHYDSTCTRDKTGRYIVRLPLKNDRETLGESRKMALKRFFSLEERLQKNPALKQEYVNFMQEYIKLGHMKEVNEKPKTKVYYLPHYAVIKEDSTTTKLRVVFDASAKTTSGQSLNSIMMTGPTLQKDLFILLLQWRMFKIVFTADIEKMYRLNTITYGTASAPYLAIKTLFKLAEHERINYPLACETLNEKFYVDDCLRGANTIKECKQIQEELILLLRKGGLNLRKWASNEPEMLTNIQIKVIEPGLEMQFNNEQAIKILGIKWSPKLDQFEFKINITSFSSKYTKRAILSDAGKLFDPFGWLSSVTIKAKIMIQKLWMLGISWDTEIPPNLQAQWEEFKSSENYHEKMDTTFRE